MGPHDAYAEHDVDLHLELDGSGARGVPKEQQGVYARWADAGTACSAAGPRAADLPPVARRLAERAGEDVAARSGGPQSVLAPEMAAARHGWASAAGGWPQNVSVSIRWRRRVWTLLGRDEAFSRGQSTIAHVVCRVRSGSAGGQAVWAGTSLTELDDEARGALRQEAEQRAIASGTGAAPVTGPHDVVLAPRATAALIHEMVAHALEGDRAAQGAHLWAQRDEVTIAPGLDVVEDGTDPGAWEPAGWDDKGRRCDEEGQPVRRVRLLGGGRVSGLVTDRVTAEVLGAGPSSGCGRRGSHLAPPIPRVRHTLVAAGASATPLEALTEGILVQDIEGGQVDTRSGRFSVRASQAHAVRGGAVTGHLTGFTLVGDLGCLARVAEIGSDVALSRFFCGKSGVWLPVSSVAPSVLIRDLEVVR